MVKDPAVRAIAYWVHVDRAARSRSGSSCCTGSPAGASSGRSGCAGRRWRRSSPAVMLLLQAQDPRRWNVEGPKSRRAATSSRRSRAPRPATSSRPKVLMNDRVLPRVPRATSTRGWYAERAPLQLVQQPGLPVLSVRETRKVSLRARRRRAGVALVRRLPRPGVVLQRRVRRPEVRRRATTRPARPASPAPSATRSRTSTARAATPTTRSRSRSHYPFAFSENAALQWVNHQLVKAKPEFHKKTFLKPLHKTAEFCSTCHKVHLPPELNHYKFLRGQNHYDTLPAVRRLRATACRASTTRRRRRRNCNGCHMPLVRRRRLRRQATSTTSGELQDPRPPVPVGANTAIPHAGRHARRGRSRRTASSTKGVMRVDLFGVQGGRHDRRRARWRRCGPQVPTLEPRQALPGRGGGPHAEDRPPLHPGDGRLERDLARRARSRAATA